MNKVVLIGRLTKDVELRYLNGSNTAVATFNLAIDRKSKDVIKKLISYQLLHGTNWLKI